MTTRLKKTGKDDSNVNAMSMMRKMRLSNNAVWFALIWLANFAIAGILLHDIVNGVFEYKDNDV